MNVTQQKIQYTLPKTSMTALSAKNRFGQFLDIVSREPVLVTKSGNPAGVLVSTNDYMYVQRELAKRELKETMGKMRQYAKKHGLTSEKLKELLQDES